MNYTQCRLRRGRIEKIAWIPAQFAVKNKFLKINDENGWRVLGVGATKPEEYLRANCRSFDKRKDVLKSSVPVAQQNRAGVS